LRATPNGVAGGRVSGTWVAGTTINCVFGPRAATSEAWSERLLALLVIAVALAAVDQWVKATVATPPWAVHQRSDLWFAGSCVILVAVLPLTRLPSRGVAIAAGIFCGGVLGNLLSAGADGLSVPNPIIVMHGMGGIAFNPADTFILAGNLSLMTALICVCVRYRVELNQWRAERRDALQRRVLRSRG
jgi:lipoprotein signal peptidase